jgi:hypothetical protein
MSALQAIERNLIALGYPQHTLRRGYKFADVLAADSRERAVELAAFTQLPESYRSAAFGVVEEHDEDVRETIAARRALGAPLFLSIAGDLVSVWCVGASGVPQRLDTVGLGALDELFTRNAERWSPQALHRAKALPPAAPRQLDFVDLGLLPAIEREIQSKLHTVLGDVLRLLLSDVPNRDRDQEQAAFQATFRLLAAKILKDREHPAAAEWVLGDVEAVLDGIAGYYQLMDSRTARIFLGRERLEAAWDRLLHSVSLQNISADTLAFVYENTLVTADNRKLFGTHSTPRQLADYVLSRLDLSRFDLNSLRIHEPFAGAGAFLVAAVRHLQDLLPTEWSPKERHNFLIPRISGCEIDVFACEVAILSLILADYPNTNGWKKKIQCGDLFEEGALAQAVYGSTVVLCNPPFEDFTGEEREKYRKTTAISVSKAQFAFKTVLEARPEALGFVMPHGFLRQKQFKDLRGRLSGQYKSIELVSLPEGIFEKARFETALVIATERRGEKSAEATRVKAGRVAPEDRKVFLDTGQSVSSRPAVRPAGNSDLWVGPLDELWESLAAAPRLGQVADVYLGLEWRRQQDGISETPRNGFRPGVYLPRESLRPFKLLPIVRWLSFEPEALRFPGPASRPWNKPKVLVNAGRISRGPWRMMAAADTTGLAASRQFFGIWPDERVSTEILSAVLNAPVANAFVFERATDHRLTKELLKEVPMPVVLDEPELLRAVKSYRTSLDALDKGQTIDDSELETKLRRIDKLVIDGYRLPKHLQQTLFYYFAGYRRPVPHRFSGWETAAPTDALHAARERALARGRRIKCLDLDAAGGGLTLQAVAELLDEPPSKVARLAEQRSLLAVPTESGPLFPTIQFSGHSPISGLHEFLRVFPDPDPWARLNYLVNPDQRLHGKRPIDSLRSGEVDQVIAAARQAGEHAAG